MKERDRLRERRDGLEAEGEASTLELSFLKNLRAANDTAEELELEVQDRILRSTVDKLAIHALPESTKGEERQSGVNTWVLRIPAKATASVALATQIRAPLEGVLTGLEELRLPQ